MWRKTPNGWAAMTLGLWLWLGGAVALVPAVFAPAAYAQGQGPRFACTFERECESGAACGAASFNVSLAPDAHAPLYRITTLGAAGTLIALDDPTALPASFAGTGTSGSGLAELLTIEADGSALLSVHIFDGTAQSVTYFGSCEVSH